MSEKELWYSGSHHNFYIVESGIENPEKSLHVEVYDSNKDLFCFSSPEGHDSAFYLSREDIKDFIKLLQEMLDITP
jgi:hypothetical protein